LLANETIAVHAGATNVLGGRALHGVAGSHARHPAHSRGASPQRPSPLCPDRDDYHRICRNRQAVWHSITKDTAAFKRSGLWQNMVNDKFLAYKFANGMGVATPDVFGCFVAGAAGLPGKIPASWGGARAG